MMGPISRTVLVSLAALGSLSTPAVLAADAPEYGAEVARRQHAMRDAMQELQEARLAYSARRYSEAVERYRNALSVIPKSTATEKQQKFIKDSLSDALIAKAIDYRSVGRTEEAVEFLQEAQQLAPDNQRVALELTRTLDPVRTNPALSPQHLAEVEEVSRLLTQAYGYMDLGRYDEAIETFRKVREYDSYNTAAMRGIAQARERKSSYYSTARDAARARSLAETSALWEESPGADTMPAETVASEQAAPQTELDSEAEQACADSLARMVLPQIIFEDASVTDVIEALQNQIRRFEASGDGASRTINLVSNFGSPSSEGYKQLMEKRVNLNLSQVSVRDVLDMLTKQLGLSYYFVPVGVELSYSGKDFGPLVDRVFTVPPHFFDQNTSADEDDDEEEDDDFADSSGVTVNRLNPEQALKQMGITFPAGASARYRASSRTLYVRNTPHNLDEIRELLNVPLGEQRQVVLNVVVMEVTQKNLEELGFDWLVKVSLNGEVFGGGGLTQAASTASGLPAITRVDPAEGDYMTGGLRSGSQVIGDSSVDKLIERGSPASFVSTPVRRAPGIFSLRGVWNTADVAVIMRGLSQKKGVDLLQNPQLLLSPGAEEQVTFASVREMYYPEEYEEGSIQTTVGIVPTRYEDKKSDDDDDDNDAAGGREIIDAYRIAVMIATGAVPSNFVRFGMTEEGMGGVGTVLQVHKADVAEDTNLVTLALTTTVTDFEGFVNWGSPIRTTMFKQPSWKNRDEDPKPQPHSPEKVILSPNTILQPIFKRHMVNTSVTVAPGSVLVFAGLKDAKKVRYEDKVPLIGDLPLVGRFFRSAGEEDTHKVLLYFAKVDVVDPSGRDVITGERPARISESL